MSLCFSFSSNKRKVYLRPPRPPPPILTPPPPPIRAPAPAPAPIRTPPPPPIRAPVLTEEPILAPPPKPLPVRTALPAKLPEETLRAAPALAKPEGTEGVVKELVLTPWREAPLPDLPPPLPERMVEPPPDLLPELEFLITLGLFTLRV